MLIHGPAEILSKDRGTILIPLLHSRLPGPPGKELVSSSAAKMFVAATQGALDPLALVTRVASVHRYHRNLTNGETVLNCLPPQGSVQREWTETPISRSFTERGIFGYFKGCFLGERSGSCQAAQLCEGSGHHCPRHLLHTLAPPQCPRGRSAARGAWEFRRRAARWSAAPAPAEVEVRPKKLEEKINLQTKVQIKGKRGAKGKLAKRLTKKIKINLQKKEKLKMSPAPQEAGEKESKSD